VSITRDDVARLAGVSTATVSYVMNDGPRPVSPETREKVLRAINVLGYKPNHFANHLARKKTRAVALVVPDSTNPFFAELAHSVQDAAFAAGYYIILCNSDGAPDRERSYFDLFKAKHIDGILLVTSGLGPGVSDSLGQIEIPIVALDRETPGLAVDTVLSDNAAVCRAATEHLLEHGHTRIACITGPPHLPNTVQRVDGYKHALLLRGIEPEDDLVCAGEFTLEGGYEAARSLLRSRLDLTAIVAENDQMAAGALHAAQELGVQLPQQLAVVGIDDTFVAKISTPRLTTVAQPVAEMSQLAISTLLGRINGTHSGPPRRMSLQGRLVVRESCGCHGERHLSQSSFESE
jgi:LacI family transcriptional regulator